jgi:uncharacterized protein (TIGR00288 family)
MNHRHQRREPTRSQSALVHRGPGAHSAQQVSATLPLHHAPNAALLIDFDNVTMGIRSDLGKELRNLLSSDIIKGKVAVQRAYADWRRYPQYIVPLSEASIDLIFAPAYGSSKKNATDIRLAIDALELVFTRPEIGTFILLSGDSDFSSLVIKLKEYGKYVIGVGIRESSSDLLVQNCDEYYSYNALAGLVKSSDDEPARKYDPWELVKEAIARMKDNRDVMRSDRLKQVMQEIDPTFDEKDAGFSKFSKFCQEAASKGLLSVRRLENGQLEVEVPGALSSDAPAASAAESARPVEVADDRPDRNGRSRRGRGGRGRGGRDRESPAAARETTPAEASTAPVERPVDGPGMEGERLTRDEAFDLVKRAVAALVRNDDSVRASAVRSRARELLGRDSESLSERNFIRILKDAHDAEVVDLRRRGDDFEVARAEPVPTVGDQLSMAQSAITPAPRSESTPARLSLRGRGSGPRGRLAAGIPPELLSLGVVQAATVYPASENGAEEPAAPSVPAKRGRKRGAKAAAPAADAAEEAPRAAKRTRRSRAKKSAKSSEG